MNPAQPLATHVAVRNGCIQAVCNLAGMQAWRPFELDTRLADRVLMAGVAKGHCHLREDSVWSLPYLGWFERRGPDGKRWTRRLSGLGQYPR